MRHASAIRHISWGGPPPCGPGNSLDDMTASATQSAEPGDSKFAASPQAMIEQLMTIARASALEEMASGVAHELNQPLGAITTFAQAAERMLNRPEPMVSGAIEVLQLISKEALGAGEGIRRMRRLFNRESLTRTPCAMGDVFRELSAVLELLALRGGGSLTIRIDRELPLVRIDRLHIQHVLFTLVQNAFEAGDAQPIAVRIEVSGDRYGVEVSVADNGRGIAAEHREQIFRPFFTTKPQGTGLGLASTRAIIESHEGTIGFQNIDQGTRFWFRLPAIDQQ